MCYDGFTGSDCLDIEVVIDCDRCKYNSYYTDCEGSLCICDTGSCSTISDDDIVGFGFSNPGTPDPTTYSFNQDGEYGMGLSSYLWLFCFQL